MPTKKTAAIGALVVAAGVAVFTAAAHMSCIPLGPSCYEAQMAPEIFVKSANEGTWVAPVGITAVSALFLLTAAYAISGAQLIKRLPFLNLALNVIAFICIVRGAATAPLLVIYPEELSVFSVTSGIIWFVSGLLVHFGHREMSTKS